ncbi:MAG: tetratricopeptide repeat protein, partial [Bacteroidota bacterium]
VSDTRRTSVHQAMGKALSRLGEHAQALHHFEEALRVTAEDHDRFDILQEIIALKITGGHYEEAVQLCQSQREFALHHANKELLASVETNLGRAEFLRGNFQESRQSFSAALEIYRSTQNKQKTVNALMNLGNVLSATHDFRGALEQWTQALALSEELGTQHQAAQIQNNIGIAHYKLREFEESRLCYEKAKQIFEDLNSKSGLALTLTNLGEVAYAEGDYERALEYWSEALKLFRVMKDAGGITETLLQLAQVWNIFGDFHQMQPLLDQAEGLVLEYRLSAFRGHLSYLRGMLSFASKKYYEALNAFLSARDSFHLESEHERFYLAVLRAAETQASLGQNKEAVCTLQGTQADGQLKAFPLVMAEFCHLLGTIARMYPEVVGEKPLVYFKQGLELVRNELVAEISWKLPYAMGKEYARRGQRDKAKENFLSAKMIIEHFASRITSPELRQKYLSVDGRGEILSEISTYLQQKTGG